MKHVVVYLALMLSKNTRLVDWIGDAVVSTIASEKTGLGLESYAYGAFLCMFTIWQLGSLQVSSFFKQCKDMRVGVIDDSILAVGVNVSLSLCAGSLIHRWPIQGISHVSPNDTCLVHVVVLYCHQAAIVKNRGSVGLSCLCSCSFYKQPQRNMMLQHMKGWSEISVKNNEKYPQVSQYCLQKIQTGVTHWQLVS